MQLNLQMILMAMRQQAQLGKYLLELYSIQLHCLNRQIILTLVDQTNFLKEMATTAVHHHFVLGSTGLSDIYAAIVKEIGLASAYDVTISDVVDPNFEYCARFGG